VHFPNINILNSQTSLLQNLGSSISRSAKILVNNKKQIAELEFLPKQKLVLGILSHVDKVSEVGLWFQSKSFGLGFAHQEAGRSAISLKNEIVMMALD
jgi:hypothetical protein